MSMGLIVAQRRVPCEVRTYLLERNFMVSFCAMIPLWNKPCRLTYINWKLAAHPHQLCSICLDLPHPTAVRLDSSNGISAELVDDLEISSERVGMLVVFGRNI